MHYKSLIFLTLIMIQSTDSFGIPPYSFLDEAIRAENQQQSQGSTFFDDLEEQALDSHAFDNVDNRPVHPFMIFLRSIGSPIVDIYILVSQKIERSWSWLMQCLKRALKKIS